MKKITTTLLAFIVLSAVFISCKKDDDSAYQPKGTYGNSTIKSGTFYTYWTLSAPSYYADINDADITQAIFDNGSVEVYADNGSGGWIALPYTIPMSSSYSSTFAVIHYVGMVRLVKTDTDMTQATDPGLSTIKIVCIGYAARMANPNLDYSNYNQVKAAFHLKD